MVVLLLLISDDTSEIVFKISVAPVIDIFCGILGQIKDGVGSGVIVGSGVYVRVCDTDEDADAEPLEDEDDVCVTDGDDVCVIDDVGVIDEEEFEENIKHGVYIPSDSLEVSMGKVSHSDSDCGCAYDIKKNVLTSNQNILRISIYYRDF